MSATTLDVGFILDGSATLGKDGFEQVKKFVEKLIGSYEISPQGTHVGVVEFSEKPTVKIPFDKSYNLEQLRRLVKEIEPSNKNARNTDLAFELAKKELFSAKNGSRPEAARIVILVTAGKSTGVKSMRDVVKPFRDDRIRIYVVGVGNKTDVTELVGTADDKTRVVVTGTPEETPDAVTVVVKIIGDDTEKSTYLK